MDTKVQRYSDFLGWERKGKNNKTRKQLQKLQNLRQPRAVFLFRIKLPLKQLPPLGRLLLRLVGKLGPGGSYKLGSGMTFQLKQHHCEQTDSRKGLGL